MTNLPLLRDSPSLDSRRLPWRPDLAARGLEGQNPASSRYCDPVVYRVRTSTSPMRKAPDSSLGLISELLHGEAFDVYDIADGWAWGQAQHDGYVGYVPLADLMREPPAPDKIVTALRTFVYPAPSIKREPVSHLPLGAKLCAEGQTGDFTNTALGFIFSPHLSVDAPYARDFVSEAERYLGVPYLWGGRSSLGLDCSGLVQQSLQAAGVHAPRDSDMQEAELGEGLDVATHRTKLQRGDLLFWPGHVAIAQDQTRMIHATGAFMAVVVEPVEAAIARIQRATGHDLRSIRRVRLA